MKKKKSKKDSKKSSKKDSKKKSKNNSKKKLKNKSESIQNKNIDIIKLLGSDVNKKKEKLKLLEDIYLI